MRKKRGESGLFGTEEEWQAKKRGDEMKINCKHCLGCRKIVFDGCDDYWEWWSNCELFGDMEVGFECGKEKCKQYKADKKKEGGGE